MKKVLILSFALALIFGFCVSSQALDLGIDHEWGYSAKMRMDFSVSQLPLMVSYPTDGIPQDVKIGVKLPFEDNAYLIVKNSFDFYSGQPFVDWNKEKFQLGLGIPFDYRNFRVRLELFAERFWSSSRSFPANLTVQYKF